MIKDLFKNSNLFLFIVMSLNITGLTACKKYLDQKPQQNLSTPSSLNDLQGILDAQNTNDASPGYLEFVGDNYYLKSSVWSGLGIADRLSYIWDNSAQVPDQTIVGPYQAIYYCNFVLDLLPKVSVTESEKDNYNNIKGQALFCRAFMYYQLAQLFCKAYDATTADNDLGIELRQTSNVVETSTRATVKQTYDKIISDLKVALDLLPTTAQFSTRPSQLAVYGLLARLYLSMRDYNSADQYAKVCLQLSNSLLDYASISALPSFVNNPEIIFLSRELSAPAAITTSRLALIDSNLINLYNTNDLRKNLFFDYDATNGGYHWKGCYYPDFSPSFIFDGIATDEVYLIRAECLARAGNADSAMVYLNTLLRKRYNSNFTNLDNTDALNKVLTERRKELVFRGLRWSDLRRFNLENANITLTRVVNGTAYTLAPNDARWALLIPQIEITRSGISQNPR